MGISSHHVVHHSDLRTLLESYRAESVFATKSRHLFLAGPTIPEIVQPARQRRPNPDLVEFVRGRTRRLRREAGR